LANRYGRIAALVATMVFFALPAPALAQSGGTGSGDSTGGNGDTSTSAGGGTGPAPTAPGETAELLSNGDAVAPASAPAQVQRAIEFANRINRKPYIYGGGHKSWKIDRGYDCSGAVSYMIHGAGRRLLSSPLPSGSLARWGAAGPGEWISVYANGGHAYAVVAGLRWDTSGGAGPRWHEDMRSSKGFRARHPVGL
jgi:cell wall-associated NlpC family hydrolase